jgi:hypothetical protein
MSGNPIEGEAWRERTPQPSQPFDRFFAAAITAHLKLAPTRDPHLDPVAVLEI